MSYPTLTRGKINYFSLFSNAINKNALLFNSFTLLSLSEDEEHFRSGK